MPSELVERLEAWKSRFGEPDTAELRRLLAEAASAPAGDAGSLIRLHECLLFLRAYAADAQVLRLADAILFGFAARLAEWRAGGGDLAPFEDPKESGIAGTSLSAIFSYEVARQLFARYPRQLAIDWDYYEQHVKLGPVLRRFLPLEQEDWPVEAHVPFRAWMDAVRPRNRGALGWLLERVSALPWAARDKADLYESLDLRLIWEIGNVRTSRSRLRLPVRKPFYHTEPLFRRSGISLAQELQGPPLAVSRLSRPHAARMLDMILDTSAMRYRELYGFTHPDRGRVFRTDLGRGVDFVFFGVPPEWRLPLRAYHAGMFFKNGVPAGYVEVLSLFERAEVGFNLYYTFREGESAWLYARLLHLFRQILGVRCFSVDPYQIGLENDEALDSGAFWFYRKLGFRPLDPQVAQLVEREERRIREKPGYRSARRTLQNIARSYVLFECPDAEPGAWDRFRVRNLALVLQKRVGAAACPLEAAICLVQESGRWSKEERTAADAIVKAKRGPDETVYLRRMQRHGRLRAAMLSLGSRIMAAN